MLWVAILMALLLGMTTFVVRQLASLPYAPACPVCHGMTTHSAHPSRMDRVLARCGGADHRHCPRCGWTGRMRWRLAAVRARRD